MIMLPVLVGAVIGLIAGILLKRTSGKKSSLAVLIMGITVTVAVGYWLNTKVFTGIVCSVLQAGKPELAVIVKGTIAAAAVINEIIAVIAAKKGFEMAGEIDS